MRLLQGRDFDDRDTLTGLPVAIVSEQYAKRFFPQGDAIGRSVSLPSGYNAPRMHIVGIVAGSSPRGLRRPVSDSAYFPMEQGGEVAGRRYLLVRARGDAESLARDVRRAVHARNPGIPVATHMLTEELEGTLTYDRLLAVLGGFIGSVAVGLAAIGLYGVLSYAVTRRAGESGVRRALGAARGGILWLVCRQSAALVVTGITLDSACTLVRSRSVESLLFGVRATDPSTVGSAAIVLLLTAVAASWIPTRRATAIDPVRALRQE